MLFAPAPADAGSSIGAGLHWLKTYGDIKDNPDFNSNNVSFWGSYQYSLPIFRVEGDLEWVPDYGGSGKSMINYQAYGLAALGLLYGGIGIGMSYYDGGFLDDPFYALRAGVDFPLGPLHLDVNANFRFMDTKILDNLGSQDMNSVTFGAFARWSL